MNRPKKPTKILELEVSSEDRIDFPRQIKGPARKFILDSIESHKREGRTVNKISVRGGAFDRSYVFHYSCEKIDHFLKHSRKTLREDANTIIDESSNFLKARELPYLSEVYELFGKKWSVEHTEKALCCLPIDEYFLQVLKIDPDDETSLAARRLGHASRMLAKSGDEALMEAYLLGVACAMTRVYFIDRKRAGAPRNASRQEIYSAVAAHLIKKFPGRSIRNLLTLITKRALDGETDRVDLPDDSFIRYWCNDENVFVQESKVTKSMIGENEGLIGEDPGEEYSIKLDSFRTEYLCKSKK